MKSLLILTATLLTLVVGCKEKKAPSEKVVNSPRKVRGVVSYRRSFPDLNEKHLAAAEAIGICPPEDRKAAEKMKKRLVLISDNDHYKVDSLTHSIPYLVPRAVNLLDVIGTNFLDSLTAKGINSNKIIVTSVLRSQKDVRRLRRWNRNATEHSAHSYGATFDVSWRRFQRVREEDEEVHWDKLKFVLAEVLRDLREDGKCYVKYERKQGCFHITAR